MGYDNGYIFFIWVTPMNCDRKSGDMALRDHLESFLAAD
jgi:hypothetical protein